MRRLEVPLLDRRHCLDRAGEIDQWDFSVFRERDDRHGGRGGRAGEQGIDLVLLDQTGRKGAGLVGIAAVVVDEQLDRFAVDAALALRSATYISSVFFSGSPRNDAGPVTESTAPILISACAAG